MILTIITLLLSSCTGWLDKEQFKELQINNEYKIDYVKYPQQDIKYFGVMDINNGAVPVLAVELIYNDDYIYIL